MERNKSLLLISTQKLILVLMFVIAMPLFAYANSPIIDLSDAYKYIGKTVTVEGKIVSAKNTGKVCLLYFGRGQIDRALHLVIFKNSYDKFSQAPEKAYLNRTVRVQGRISLYRGNAQIIVNSQRQIVTIDKTPLDFVANYWHFMLMAAFLVCLVPLFIRSRLRKTNTASQSPQKVNDLDKIVSEEIKKTIRDEIPRQLSETFKKEILITENIESARKKIKGEILYNEDIRNKLEQSFQIAQMRVDIISPWLTRYGVNNKMIRLMKAALDRGVSIRIIYGYEGGDLEEESIKLSKNLEQYFHNYNNSFKIRRVNTHEKLLICDELFFLIGSYNLLSFSGKYGHRTRNEMMLYSEDIEILRQLRKKYFSKWT